MFKIISTLVALLFSQSLWPLPQLETKTQPKFKVVPCKKGENRVQLRQTDITDICYVVTNSTKITRCLNMDKINAIEQIVTGNLPSSGISLPYERCATTFCLPHNESCLLHLRIYGNKLLARGIHGGPVVGLAYPAPPSTGLFNGILGADRYLASQPSPEDAVDATITTAPVPIMTVGSYADSSGSQRPLLALSADSGNTWSYPTDITQPSTTPTFSDGGVLVNVTCNESTCMAVGSYIDDSDPGTRRPLLALSTDSGNTWSYPTDITQPSTTPTFSGNGALASITCNKSTCMAVGSYADSSGKQRPLLALSTDSGGTWSYPTDVTEPNTGSTFSGDGALASITCNESTCMAVGTYSSSGTQLPLLALSTNSGGTWSYPTDITNPNGAQPSISPAFTQGALASVTCNESICMAVGGYTPTSGFLTALLALSTDSGNTWSYPTGITQPNTANPPLLVDQTPIAAALTNIICNEGICMAIGAYSSPTRYPLLALSTDSGSTWGYPPSGNKPASAQPPISPTYFSIGGLKNIIRNGSTYMTVGFYGTNNNGVLQQLPLLGLSTDSGNTWSYPTDITQPSTTPTFSDNGVLVSVTCNESTCMAVGSYTDDSDPGTKRPLLALSTDSGNTWSYPTDITQPSTTPTFSGKGVLTDILR